MINNEIVKLGINYEKHKGSVIQENQLWEKKFIKLWEKKYIISKMHTVETYKSLQNKFQKTITIFKNLL